jgi:hypothetical protein
MPDNMRKMKLNSIKFENIIPKRNAVELSFDCVFFIIFATTK